MPASRWTHSASSRRLGAALVASALAHLVVSSGVKPGSDRQDLPGQPLASATRSISVQLEQPEPQRPMNAEAEARRQPTHVRAPALASVKTFDQTEPAARDIPKAASAGPAEIPDPTYYAARELDVYPALLTTLDLRYPDGASIPAVKGRVLLLVRIDANGIVEDVSVAEAEPGGYFEDDARRAFASARFTPAVRNGRPVKSRVAIEVNYATEASGRQ